MPSQTHVSLSAPSLYPTKIDHRYYHKAFCFHLIVLIIHWFNGQPFKHSIRWFSCILKFIRYTKHMNQELHIVLWFIITNHKTLLGPNCTICILSQLAFRKGLKMRSKCRIAVRIMHSKPASGNYWGLYCRLSSKRQQPYCQHKCLRFICFIMLVKFEVEIIIVFQ